MKKIGLFCGKNAKKTATVALQIKEVLGKDLVDIVYVEEVWIKDFNNYEYLIAGAATWFDGELPAYWDEIIPLLGTLEFKGKKVAVFGLGDQIKYPDNFVDSIGILANAFAAVGATVVGKTSIEGYQFNQSRASDGSHFAGLVLDIENEPEKNDQRIQDWVEDLKKEFV